MMNDDDDDDLDNKAMYLLFFAHQLYSNANIIHYSFPQACPVAWGLSNGYQWFFNIVFCHPPSSFPVQPFSGLCPQHPAILYWE